MSLCDKCVSGVRHEGAPEGKIDTIADVECYISTPTGEYLKNKVLLFLPDIFGIPLNNSKLLSDDFARNGFKTIIPDYLNGEAVPADEMAAERHIPHPRMASPSWLCSNTPHS